MSPTATQQRIPGTESEIDELIDAAKAYVSVRDERMALTPLEVDAKATVLRLMKKHKKENYTYEGLTIDVIAEVETVRVRIRKPKQEEQK